MAHIWEPLAHSRVTLDPALVGRAAGVEGEGLELLQTPPACSGWRGV